VHQVGKIPDARSEKHQVIQAYGRIWTHNPSK